jgi:hypothetical protein
MEEANRISKEYYDRTATDRQFSKGEKIWLYDSSTRKGQCAKLSRKWKIMTVLEQVSDLNYRLCDPETGKVMKHPVHVNRIRKLDVNRDLWYSKYPDTECEDANLQTQQVGNSFQSSPRIQSQAVSNDQGNTNITPKSKTQDRTDKKTKPKDQKLPSGWYTINRLLGKRKNNGVVFYKVEWSDLGPDGRPLISWERASSVTEFAIDRYHLALDEKRKRRKPRQQK